MPRNTEQTKGRFHCSLDIDLVEKLNSLPYGEGSRMVNRILRDHLGSYLDGKPKQVTESISREEVRQILREELVKLKVEPVAGEKEPVQKVEVTEELENTVMSFLDNVIGMRENKG